MNHFMNGFSVELIKLAAPMFDTGPSIKPMGQGKTIPSAGYQQSGQARKGEGQAIFSKRKAQAPAQPGSRPQKQIAKQQSFGANKGGGPSQNSPFASKTGRGLMGSVVGPQTAQKMPPLPGSSSVAKR